MKDANRLKKLSGMLNNKSYSESYNKQLNKYGAHSEQVMGWVAEWNEIKNKMVAAGTWADFCKQNGYSTECEAFDCMA